MINVETLQNLANSHFVIPVWEVVFYVAVITLYALMGKPGSCLINTYAFTFYWGFKSLLPGVFTANGFSQMTLTTYIVCGLGIYGLITVASIRQARKRKDLHENPGIQTS